MERYINKYFFYYIFFLTIFSLDNLFARYYDPRKEKAEYLFKEAFSYYQKFKYQKAIKLYREALELEPEFVKAWFWLGKSYYKVGLLNKAIFAYKRFMELGGGNYHLRRKINSIYYYEYDKHKIPYTFTHLSSWRGEKLKAAYFYNPTSIAIDSKENVYIVSISLHKVLKFSPSGNLIFSIGKKGREFGEFNMPFGICVDKDDNFYVTDFGNDRVLKFSPEGKFLMMFGKKGIKEGEFLGPEGIVVDKFYNIFVVDNGNRRIQKFDKKGKFLMLFGEIGSLPSRFLHPSYITIDKDLNIWVSDLKKGSVKKFDYSGNFLAELTLPLKEARPNGITTDIFGNIYICDSKEGVFRFNFKNNEWDVLYGWNEGLDKFLLAKAIALGKDGILYVADYSRSCIDIFSPEEFTYFNFNINVDQIYTKYFPVVIHAVTVTTKDRKPVLGLTSENFRVIENGIIISPIEVYAPFQKEDNLVVSMVINTHLRMEKHKSELKKICKGIINSLKPEIQAATIISFDEKANQLCPRTLNISKLNHAIDKLKFTSFFHKDALPKAIYHGIRETLDLPWKKALILFTTGRKVREESHLIEKCIHFAKNNYVPLFIVDFKEGTTTNFLKRLSKDTYGNYYHFYTSREVKDFYKEIIEKTKNQNQYFIYYNSPLTLWPNTWIDTIIQVEYLGLYGEDRGGFVIP